MAKEIERKFLVKDDSYKVLALKSVHIMQGYLSTDKRATVRVRMWDDDAFLTVKGENRGAVRDEWEYPIPKSDALESRLLQFQHSKNALIRLYRIFKILCSCSESLHCGFALQNVIASSINLLFCSGFPVSQGWIRRSVASMLSYLFRSLCPQYTTFSSSQCCRTGVASGQKSSLGDRVTWFIPSGRSCVPFVSIAILNPSSDSRLIKFSSINKEGSPPVSTTNLHGA